RGVRNHSITQCRQVQASDMRALAGASDLVAATAQSRRRTVEPVSVLKIIEDRERVRSRRQLGDCAPEQLLVGGKLLKDADAANHSHNRYQIALGHLFIYKVREQAADSRHVLKWNG